MTTLLVDGNNVLMRSVKAAEGGHLALSNEGGTPTAPLLIFINTMSRYIKEVGPSRLLICWDDNSRRYREAIFPDYKSERAQPDSDVDEFKEGAFALAKQFCALANLPTLRWPDYEADDLIAVAWRNRTGPVTILSGDKDLLQLVRDDVVQIRPGQDGVWDPARVEERFGCRPEHWGIVLAMVGDPGDGVPGIHRVGEKTACKALAAVDWDLEALLCTEKFQPHIDTIRRNIRLVVLPMPDDPHPDMKVEAPEFRPTTHDNIAWPELLSFLDRYDLASVRSKLLTQSLWR